MTTKRNLASLLEETARLYPLREAIVHGRDRVSYRELNRRASQVAHALVERGIRPGDKVALSCPNVPFFTAAYFGILKTGAVVVPLNVLLKSREIAYHLNDSDARAYLCFEDTPSLQLCTEGHDGFALAVGCEEFLVLTAPDSESNAPPGTERLVDAMAGKSTDYPTAATDADDTAVLLYTSGTTGHPKGAELRHRNLLDNAQLSDRVFGSRATHPDTYLCVLPLFHSFGQTCIQNSAIAYGGRMVMITRFEPHAALEAMAAERVTYFAGVPTMYWQLLSAIGETDNATHFGRHLRVAASGGAALPVEIHREFKSRFNLSILEGYGLSETSPVASFTPWRESPRPGSIGKPVAGVEMRLIDESWSEVNADGTNPETVGEIAIRGHNIMKGYYRRPKATSEVIRDGWFRTGDLARRDTDGWYYIVDRSKDLIIRGGFNVYPREVEEVLMTHPDVSLAAVLGVPHESHGEEIKAFVILHPSAATTEAELIEWCRLRVAGYKYPRIVEVVDSLPMTATGKILKRELAQAPAPVARGTADFSGPNR